MESIWSQSVSLSERPSLERDLKVDVAILGGGLAGVLTAFHLRRQGVDAVVLEAHRVGSGQSKNTTAKVTSQHGLIYSRLIDQFGQERARQYAHANQRAIEDYRQILQELQIECEW